VRFHDFIIELNCCVEFHRSHQREARAQRADPGQPFLLIQRPDEAPIDRLVIPSLAEGQMKLDLLDKVAEIIDVLAHRSLRRLLEVVKSFLKDAEFRITPCTVLLDKFLPGIGSRFAPNDSGVIRRRDPI